MVRQIVALLIITFGHSRALSENVPEFQYPCYVDVCTFPTQFCNSDKYERRCSPCSRAICRQTNVPLACRYICMKHNELSTTAKPTTTTLAPSKHQATQGNDNLAPLHLIMSYSAITTTLLVILLLAFIAYYIHRKKLAKEKKKNDPPFGNRSRITRDRNCDQAEGLLEEITTDCQELCPRCGQRPRPEFQNHNISPPSYTTCDRGILPLQNSNSDTRSNSPGSTESMQSSAKTVLVKPMASKPQQLLKSGKSLATEKNIGHKNVTDSEIQTTGLESLLNSQEVGGNDETSLKLTNTQK